MILGTGTIAKIIPDREGFTFFACGESNRFELTDYRKKVERERILAHVDHETMFVYISGLHIYYPDGGRSAYNEHKLNMEQLVKNNFINYCIFRLGSVTWGDNPNTLINYIKNQIKLTGDCEAKPVYRYLHTKEELTHWFGMIPTKGKHEMNVTGRIVWVPDLVEQIKKGKL